MVIQMISLEHYGWNNVFQPNTTCNTKNELIIGRVTSIQGFKYFVITSSGEMETELAGKLAVGERTRRQHHARGGSGNLAVAR